jgi:CubicO group peptidase (beta-lactamase class C family)
LLLAILEAPHVIRKNSLRLRTLSSASIAALAVTALILLSLPSFGQDPRPNPAAAKVPAAAEAEQPAHPSSHALTPGDLETFLDGVMPLQLKREDVAGAVISVVKDGKLFFSKGYGYSDVAKKVPVSPSSTLFRPGSVSKLFTWTAVMQLQEQGKLDLDRDVNEYLDFKVPATYPKPITLRDLMTHTPGFEETLQELFEADAKDLKPLSEYMKAHLPERVYPPFTTPAYSNYGATMAGYIVERISGENFDTYVEEHIFKPLGMMHTTFRQPLPDALKPLMSNGYPVASGKAGTFEIVQAEPAGSSSSTAEDMARFMIAHLQDGRFEDVKILRPETARLMHSRQFVNLPEMNAMCLGFYEETRNGHRIIGHAGDTEYFHSDLHLMADAGLGFFVSYNSGGKGENSPRTTLWQAVLDRYFPFEPPSAQTVSTAAQDAAEVSGAYLSSRRADTTILKVLTVLGELKVHPNKDGSISADAFKDLNGIPKKFAEIAPLLFRDVNGQDRVGFKRDDTGRMILVIDFPFMVFQKATWYENSGLNLPILIFSVVVLLLTLLLWPVAALVRRHYGKKLELTPQQRKLRRLIRIVCALELAFLALFMGFFAMGLKDLSMFYPKYNPLIRTIQIVGWLGVLGGVLVLYRVLRSFAERGRWLGSRIADCLAAFACLGFIWFVFTWNMLHWSLKY